MESGRPFFTPETSSTTHFFWDYLHDYDLQDPKVALSLYHSMVEGFMEDKAIIEQQQQMLEADPSFQMNAIVADAPLVHFRRTLARMIAEERGGMKTARPRRFRATPPRTFPETRRRPSAGSGR